MSASEEEAPELSTIVGALLLNFGTLSEGQIAVQTLAGREAKRNGRMVVFDPVGVGATKFRRQQAEGELGFAFWVRGLCGSLTSVGAYLLGNF